MDGVDQSEMVLNGEDSDREGEERILGFDVEPGATFGNVAIL